MIPSATADLHEATRRRSILTLALLHREWRRVDPWSDWPRLRLRLAAVLSAAMSAAAVDGGASVPLALAQTGYPTTPVATVVGGAFGRTASDGRQLASLVDGAIVRARTARGLGHPDPLSAAVKQLDRVARTQIADATREASQAAITASPGAGWVRMVNVPCCQDCAVQAGRWFRHNAGFRRHPCLRSRTASASTDLHMSARPRLDMRS